MTVFKILIMGLPGSGKTTLAMALRKRMAFVHFNGDKVRENISRDLGFSLQDRVEQARRMGWLCDQVVASGMHAVADFVCPTFACRNAFAEDGFGRFGLDGYTVLVFVNRIDAGRFADTNDLFESPLFPHFIVNAGVGVEQSADHLYRMLVDRLGK